MRRDYITMAVAIVAIVIAVFSIIRVQNANVFQNAQMDTLDKIKSTGKINVCYVPFATAVIKDPSTGKLSGHSVNTIEYIASQINAKVNYVESTWGNLVTDVSTGKCDMTLYYFNLIPRAYTLAFTDPIIYEGNTAVVRTNDRRFDGIKDVMEFDNANYNVVVANGEAGHVFVKDNFKNAKVDVIDVEAGDVLGFMNAVSTGRADVAIVSVEGGNDFAKKHPEVKSLFATDPFSLNSSAYAMRQNDLKLLNFLNNALSMMEIKGMIRQFEKKYDAKIIYKKEQYLPSN